VGWWDEFGTLWIPSPGGAERVSEMVLSTYVVAAMLRIPRSTTVQLTAGSSTSHFGGQGRETAWASSKEMRNEARQEARQNPKVGDRRRCRHRGCGIGDRLYWWLRQRSSRRGELIVRAPVLVTIMFIVGLLVVFLLSFWLSSSACTLQLSTSLGTWGRGGASNSAGNGDPCLPPSILGRRDSSPRPGVPGIRGTQLQRSKRSTVRSDLLQQRPRIL
jgi:hypothetical protein